jgi:hypothetical protein
MLCNYVVLMTNVIKLICCYKYLALEDEMHYVFVRGERLLDAVTCRGAAKAVLVMFVNFAIT